jgi:hypothetical protein
MTKLSVQCQGSGKKANASLNTKRFTCPSCHRAQDVNSNGRIRKHNRLMTKSQLRRIK